MYNPKLVGHRQNNLISQQGLRWYTVRLLYQVGRNNYMYNPKLVGHRQNNLISQQGLRWYTVRLLYQVGRNNYMNNSKLVGTTGNNYIAICQECHGLLLLYYLDLFWDIFRDIYSCSDAGYTHVSRVGRDEGSTLTTQDLLSHLFFAWFKELHSVQ